MPSLADSHRVRQLPSSRRYVWTPPPAPKGRIARFWDQFAKRITAWIGSPPAVVEPPEWFARAQADSRRDLRIGSES
jgi:hypothetical protein